MAFQLVVTEDDSWISRMTKVASGDVTSETAALRAAVSMDDRESEQLRSGETVPDFQLIDQDGESIQLSDYRGKAVVLTFIYTRCPIPNFCPLMSKNFADLQARLAEEFPGRFHLVSMSIDPKFDRPEVLRNYAGRYDADPKHWTFATGDEDQINFVAGLMGLFHEPENGLISHDLRTALIGPDGRMVHLWRSNAWTPYEVHRMVREAMTGSRDYAAQ